VKATPVAQALAERLPVFVPGLRKAVVDHLGHGLIEAPNPRHVQLMAQFEY
jgi:hypothetical protein